MIRILSCLIALPLFTGDQEDLFETRLYNVEILTQAVTDRPGANFGLDVERPQTPARREEERRLLAPDSLINLIKANIAEDSWTHASARIAVGAGELSVVNRASVHAKIEPYLAYLRSALARLITIDALVVLADPAFLSKIRAAGPADRPASLAADQVRQLQEAAREGKQADLVKALRVTAHPGQRVHLQEATQHSFLRDPGVPLSPASPTLDPGMEVFATGAGFDIRASLEPFGGAVTLEVRADATELETLENRKLKLGKEQATTEGRRAAGLSAEAMVQLPRVAHDTLRTTATARSGETLLLGTLLRKGRALVFLITPTILPLDEKPAPEPALEEQRILKVYDVSPLTQPLRHFAAPPTGLRSPPTAPAMKGGPFALDEPAARLSARQIADLLKTRVAPESWANKRNAMGTEEGRLLVVRQKPEVIKEIDRTLGTLLQARAQMVTTEAVAVGFRKGTRSEWEKEIPALGTGGYFVEDAKLEKLLAETSRERRVRLIALGEITGFPQERVFVSALREENLIVGFVPKAGANGSLFDPSISTLHTGFALDVLPRPDATGDRISVELSASSTSREIREIETTSAGVGPVQTPKVEGPRWSADVVCAKGRWTLVAIETRGPPDDAEDVALFLRARLNSLK